MRVSHLAALATLVALLGAMFVAMQSASAAGACRESGGVITLGFSQTCTVSHDDVTSALVTGVAPDAAVTVDETDLANGNVTIAGGSANVPTTANATVTLYGNGPDENDDNGAGDDVALAMYTVRVVGLAIVGTAVVGDEDNRVSAGPQFTARVTVRSPATGAQVRVTVPSTGLSLVTGTGTDEGTTQSRTMALASITETATHPNTDATDGVVHADFMVNTAGAPAGEYTITFEVDDNNFATANPTGVSNPTSALKVEIGDPGTGLTSATLSLGNSMDDVPYTADNEAMAETGTAPAATGDGINLVIEAFDSLGGKANAASIDQIIVIAPGGDVSVDGRDATTGVTSNQSGATIREYDEDQVPDNADTMDNVGPRTVIRVKKAGGAQAKPGMVTVYAIVSGSGGAATTERLTLNFSGATASVAVADATDTLRSVNEMGDDPATPAIEDANNVIEDTIKLAVTGQDSGGITSDPGSGFTINITGPGADGPRVNSDKMTYALGSYAGGKRDLTITGMGSAGAPLKAGEYTVKLTRSGLDDASAMFSVAGKADTVTIDVGEVDDEGQFEVTVTVMDAEGTPVADGTVVSIANADLRGDFDQVIYRVSSTGKTDDGVATATFIEIGPGRAAIIATADGKSAVARVISTYDAPEPEAMPEEEASVGCLSELSGFATWSCGVDSSASEIFGLVEGRGATAIHLWNGTAWVRYSVVDSTMVPGSSDFMVTENDILYISN